MNNLLNSFSFQFYPPDWFGSRHVSAMNSSMRGIHATLIFAAWLEPCCGFPVGEELLTARVSVEEETNCFQVLSMCWFKYENFWFNEKLLNVRIERVLLSSIRKTIGSTGGRPRISKTSKSKPIGKQLDSKSKPNDNQNITKLVVEDVVVDEDNNNPINNVYRECSVLLRDRVLQRKQAKITDVTLKGWDNDVRLMVERDGRSVDDIKLLINECHDMEKTKSGFTWADNILSMGTLRKQWNTGKVWIGMNKKAKKDEYSENNEDIPILDLGM